MAPFSVVTWVGTRPVSAMGLGFFNSVTPLLSETSESKTPGSVETTPSNKGSYLPEDFLTDFRRAVGSRATRSPGCKSLA